MTLEQKTDIKTVPLQGGAITVREKPLLPFGAFSMIQNMRGKHPGFEKRTGSAQHHTTYLGALKTLSLYQFSKGRRTERHFLAQMSDDDVYDATNAPPGTGTTFGSAIFTGTATSKPASWGNIDDILIFSNCKNQHQLYAGTANYVKRFIKFDGSAAPTNIPTEGYDYTLDVTDGKTTTYGNIDLLDVYNNHQCLFICCPVPANKLTWTINTGHVNAADSVTTLEYWKNDNNWVDLVTAHSFDDTTDVTADKTLSGTGSMTWTHPTDEIPKFMFGYSGFWYRLSVSVQLDSGNSTIEVSSLTYGSSFASLQNVWSGDPPYAIEAQFYDQSASIYKRFPTDSVEIDEMVHSADDSTDRIYINSPDPITGLYFDFAGTPNTTTTTTVSGVKCFTGGESWTSVGTVTDGTNGFNNSGWITWPRPPYSTTYYPEKTQFQTSKYYAYWYYIYIATATLNDDVICSIQTMPYFDIEEFGTIGYVNCVWKDRAIYSFDDNLGYASAKYKPMCLNGDDFGVLEAGDGRANKWVCAKRFHNELLVWQEEKGSEGGCLTVFEGYSPQTFGKLVLSTKIGSLNAKSAVVLDGVMTSTRTDEELKTLGFFISHYGVFVTDGRTVTGISDDIQNYFDPGETECLRRGYDDEAFIFHDTSCNVLRLGIVSGEPIMTSTATATTGDKLTDTEGAFTTRKTVTGHPISHTIAIGDTVYNTTDKTTALITAVDSATALSLDTNIMASGEGYQILSATVNLYPVFDLVDWTWGFDILGQNISAMCEVEGATLQLSVLQYGGGTDDGFIYRLNTGTNDYDGATAKAITSYVQQEFNGQGEYIVLSELLLLMKTQGTGNAELTAYQNGVAVTAVTDVNLSMTAENTGEIIRRHRKTLNVKDQHISVKFQHDTLSQSCYLEAVGYDFKAWEKR